jgi:carbon starvation protein
MAVVTTILFNTGRGRYAPVTLLPMLFVATTTTTTAYYEIYGRFWKKMVLGGEPVRGWLNIGLTVMLLVCVAVIVGSAILRWINSTRRDENVATTSPAPT